MDLALAVDREDRSLGGLDRQREALVHKVGFQPAEIEMGCQRGNRIGILLPGFHRPVVLPPNLAQKGETGNCDTRQQHDDGRKQQADDAAHILPALCKLADEIRLEPIHHRAQFIHLLGDREEARITSCLGIASRAFCLDCREDVIQRTARERRDLRDRGAECRLVIGKLRKGCELCVKIGAGRAEWGEVLLSPRREIAAIGGFHVEYLPLNDAGRGLEIARLPQVREGVHHLHPDLQHCDDRKHEHQQADDQRDRERTGQIEHTGSRERRGTAIFIRATPSCLTRTDALRATPRDRQCSVRDFGAGSDDRKPKILAQTTELTCSFRVLRPASPSH